MNEKPILSISAPLGVDVVSTLGMAIGEHYDVRLETVPLVIDDATVGEPVIRIYRKGDSRPLFSLWLSE